MSGTKERRATTGENVNRTRRNVGAYAAVLVLGLAGLVACGSDDAAAPLEIVAATTTAPSVTSADGAGPTTSAVCGPALEIARRLAVLDLSDPAGLADLPTAVASLKDVVPAEFAGDVDLVAQSVSALVKVLERFDFDLEAARNDPEGQADLGAVDSTGVQEAVDRINNWLLGSC